MNRPNIELGDRVSDAVTGFTGVVTALADYIDGCRQACISPKVDKDGKLPDAMWFDVERITIKKAGAVKVDAALTGGPSHPSHIPSKT